MAKQPTNEDLIRCCGLKIRLKIASGMPTTSDRLVSLQKKFSISGPVYLTYVLRIYVCFITF